MDGFVDIYRLLRLCGQLIPLPHQIADTHPVESLRRA